MIMDMNDIYGIYNVESLQTETIGDEQESWFHAYLLLAKQKGARIFPIQELHFNQDKNWNFAPTIKINLKEYPPPRPNVYYNPVLLGHTRPVLEKWRGILLFAKNFKERKISNS